MTNAPLGLGRRFLAPFFPEHQILEKNGLTIRVVAAMMDVFAH